MTHNATCRCGQLRVSVTGEPTRVSVCHCLNCQKRSGSAFAAQARWPSGQVEIAGLSKTHVMLADSGNSATFHFCPECGTDVYYVNDGKFDGQVAIPLGTFEDPYFLAPRVSVWEQRKHDWVAIVGGTVEHFD